MGDQATQGGRGRGRGLTRKVVPPGESGGQTGGQATQSGGGRGRGLTGQGVPEVVPETMRKEAEEHAQVRTVVFISIIMALAWLQCHGLQGLHSLTLLFSRCLLDSQEVRQEVRQHPQGEGEGEGEQVRWCPRM